ncbi:recombinase RecF [Putridiphycobacter roseus]|uniref:Recombinase RecF n=1 Tax=Putridiphycobacter roseus TaxID=2219161 RepID=A0A2W1NBW8_9FLAO|nr:AAA family ATPase [Putridiphycobacter roseus]PZE15606.1 recombinase RecF [Putridiphycobacter roseus]
MKIKKILIEGVGGLESIELTFDDHMNLLCGPNGIGKTTILETIAHLFSAGTTTILKRNVNSEKAIIQGVIEVDGENKQMKIEFDTFVPEAQNNLTGFYQDSKKLFSLKTTRNLQYSPLASVPKDTEKREDTFYSEARTGITLNDIKSWFVNRFLYSAHPGALKDEQIANYELAKKCFSLLNESFTFSKVDASSNEIMVNTPSGEIYYEYLSSGFKSIIAISFGIIKEIEFRFKNPRINAVDFDGIITIDEIDLHLHPEWQSTIVRVLSEMFPKAQFIVTTHSPHIIQAANPNQIISLGVENGKVIQRELPDSKYGFQGWTIEEVLTDVMGMSDLRTDLFNNLLDNFGMYIDAEEYEKAKECYEQIDSILHPQNHVRKLLKFQLASIKN